MLHNLRQKPEHQKRKIAVVTSILVTAIIFVVWLSSTIHSFSVLNAEPGESGEITQVPESPFSIVKENIASAYESISKDVGKVKDQMLGQ
jgi:hypothetical protein